MTSKSKAILEHLEELEKLPAPFGEQLIEAAKFVGVSFEHDGKVMVRSEESDRLVQLVPYKREEWLLIWLAKKLKAEEVARKLPSSWWLLCYLVEALQVCTAARILASREVIVEEKENPSKQDKTSILQQSLYEAQKFAQSIVDAKITNQMDVKKTSKKRNHSGELVATEQPRNYVLNLMDAISALIQKLTKAGSFIPGTSADDLGSPLSAAHMQMCYTTSAEKAAMIFGSWLSLCEVTLCLAKDNHVDGSENWLAPFTELWECRMADPLALVHFSLHCTRPILAMLRIVRNNVLRSNLEPALECLVARNIVIPAKRAYFRQPNSNLLEAFTRTSVIQDTFNAPVIFDIVVRSIQLHGTKRRRPEDEAWILMVFKTLMNCMPSQLAAENSLPISAMLECAILHKVDIDLEVLRSITSEFALSEDGNNWELLATITKLDANVFLIPNKGNDLLNLLFTRITNASLEPSWPKTSEQIVSNILVPLMGEFAKARDLSGFIKHWFCQLVKLEQGRKIDKQFSKMTYGAWDDNAIQIELRKLLEPSLTTQQISQLLDWLSTEVSSNQDAVCFMLEAISGSLSGQEDIVDCVSLRPYQIMFDEKNHSKLGIRYRWRAWRLLTHTLEWATVADVDKLAGLWETEFNPFACWKLEPTSLLKFHELVVVPDCVEVFRCSCAALSTSRVGSRMESVVKPIVLDYLRCLISDVSNLLSEGRFQGYMKLENQYRDAKNNCLPRSIASKIYILTRCVFIEYPKTLIVGLELGTRFQEMIESIFTLASESFVALPDTFLEWLQVKSNAYPDLWMAALQSDEVLNTKKLTKVLIDIMLVKNTFIDPQTKNTVNNAFAIQAWNRIPLEILTKKNREEIMKSWLPLGNKEITDPRKLTYAHTAVDPAVLALKRRIMDKHPNLYEGLSFDVIICIADTLSEVYASKIKVSLELLKDIVRLTFIHAHKNLDQVRRKSYVIDAFTTLQTKIKKAGEKKKMKLGLIAVFGATLAVFQERSVALDELDIISKEQLETTINNFKEHLLSRLNKLLHKYGKKKAAEDGDSSGQDLLIVIIIDSLAALGVSSSQLAEIEFDGLRLVGSPDKAQLDTRRRLETFLAAFKSRSSGEGLEIHFEGDISSSLKRNSIKQVVEGAVSELGNAAKLNLLSSLFGANNEGVAKPEELIAARFVIMSIQDTKPTKKKYQNDSDDSDDSDSGSVQNEFNLTKAYLVLCEQLRETSEILKFCIISETLELMLRTKIRSISQYAIDSTLGTISIICSPKGPLLPATRSGTIYLHLSFLLRTILIHHRLKLRGHFPLVQLTMQGLLRCLFRPLPKSSVITTEAASSSTPVWLANSKYQLTARHAESYTRLLTLICDPSASSVRGTKHNNLTSATEKWKRTVLLFMRFVLMDYIKWQLELCTLPEIRDKLMPGIYAIFDNTTPETRRLINSDLSASGRVIFGSLYKDYLKFGRWKG